VHFDEGRSIWIPSVQFAKSLKGKVKSGSITGGLWAKAKRGVDKALGFVIGAPAFVFGVLEGVVLEVKDLIVGTAAGVIAILKSILKGSILSDAKELWDSITHLDLRRVLGDMWRNFEGRKKNPWDRWSYRGEVIGRGVAMAVLTFFSGGSALVARAGSKLAQLAAKLKGLSVVQRFRKAIPSTKRKRVERTMRREDLARDPDKGARVTDKGLKEADDALALERLGAVPKPVRRANGAKHPRENGADFVDGDGGLWDHKFAISGRGFDPRKYLDGIERNDIRNGERIMLNHEQLERADLRRLLAEIDDRGLRSHFRFLPPL
jgi:hypothetical protein